MKNDARSKNTQRWTASLGWIWGTTSCEDSVVALVAHVGQQGHEAGALDGERHGVLAGGGATALATANDLALPIGQFGQQVEILVVDVHRTRTFAIDKNRILLFCPDLVLVGSPFRRPLKLLHRTSATWRESAS